MDIYLARGKSLIVDGPSSIFLEAGKIECAGALIEPNTRIEIDKYRRLSFYAIEDARILIEDGENSIRIFDGETIPLEIKKLMDSLKPACGTKIMIIGGIDTGKSFITRYIANRLIRKGFTVGIIDCDIGQSDIGPPTVIGVSIIDRPIIGNERLKLHNGYFVGSITPTSHLLQTVLGTKLMTDYAFEHNAEVVVINTTGMVMGGPARALKISKIESILPQYIIAIQRENELEHILSNFKYDNKIKIIRVSAPDQFVRKRDRITRRNIRNMLYKKHFANAREIEFDIKEIQFIESFFGSGWVLPEEDKSKIAGFLNADVIWCERFPDGILIVVSDGWSNEKMYLLRAEYGQVLIKRSGFERGLLCALLGTDKKFITLGIVRKIDFLSKKITIFAPEVEPDVVRYIKFGHVYLDNEFNEVAILRPGHL